MLLQGVPDYKILWAPILAAAAKKPPLTIFIWDIILFSQFLVGHIWQVCKLYDLKYARYAQIN